MGKIYFLKVYFLTAKLIHILFCLSAFRKYHKRFHIFRYVVLLLNKVILQKNIFYEPISKILFPGLFGCINPCFAWSALHDVSYMMIRFNQNKFNSFLLYNYLILFINNYFINQFWLEGLTISLMCFVYDWLIIVFFIHSSFI